MATRKHKRSFFDSPILRGHRSFFSLLTTLLLGIFIVLAYTAIQNQQVYRSSAAGCTWDCPPQITPLACTNTNANFTVTYHPMPPFNDHMDILVGVSYWSDSELGFDLAPICAKNPTWGGNSHQFQCAEEQVLSSANGTKTFNIDISQLVKKDNNSLRIIARQHESVLLGPAINTFWGGPQYCTAPPPPSSCTKDNQQCGGPYSVTCCSTGYTCQNRQGPNGIGTCLPTGGGGGGGGGNTCGPNKNQSCSGVGASCGTGGTCKDSANVSCSTGYVPRLCPGLSYVQCCGGGSGGGGGGGGGGTTTHTITVKGKGTGSGTITDPSKNIDCKITSGVASGECTKTVNDGGSFTLTAKEDAGSVFDGVSCAPSGVCVRSGTTVTSTNVKSAITATMIFTTGAPPPGGTGTITLPLKLSFQGILSEPVSTATMSAVKVTLSGGTLTQDVPQTADFTSDANGVFSGTVTFDNITPGANFKVLVKGPKHVQKKICDATPTETAPGTYHCEEGNITLVSGTNSLDFSGINLLIGDLPVQDGIIDAPDVALIRDNLGSTDSTLLSKADVNLDGFIDAQDFSLLIESLNVKYDEQ